MDYVQWFRRVTGHSEPHPWQRELSAATECTDRLIRYRPAMTMDGTWLWQLNNGFQNQGTGLPGLPHPKDGANRKAYY